MSSTPLTASGGRFRLRDLVPFGPRRHPRPRPFLEMLGIAWENRDNLPYAWRILNHGVCDGCSLGPRGLRDDVIAGVHLCMTRLKLLRLNTMGPAPDAALADLAALRRMPNDALRRLGRLPYPLIHRAGSDRLQRLSWDEALRVIGAELADVPGERMGFFATSRGLVNETYYAFQKAARLMGSNHVDLCARLCHAASVSGLKDTLGVPAPTCSLKDLIGSDLVVILGSHLANNQPVTMKYLVYAKRKGTRIVVVNPMREPGLERYWVPSDLRSAVFGTRLMDDFFPVAVGGDIAFLHGVLKHLIEREWWDRAFVERHTTGFDAVKALVAGLSWERLERAAGQTRAEMLRFAETYARARTAVFVYSMGLTQHRFGVDNVKALVNLALARGMLGREKCGIMPIRGHSGVQGGGECGVDPDKLPGGFEIANAADRARFEELWRHPLPAMKGLRTLQMLEAAHAGAIDFLYSLGGNLLETMPDRAYMHEALARVRLRVHQDIVLNSSSLLEGGTVVLLPAQTRYETPGGGTSTSTERRIRFTPEIEGPRIAEARPEWEIPVRVAIAARPALAGVLDWPGTAAIRAEMARAMPTYGGVEHLEREGQWVQWGGERLFTDGFTRMPEGRARFSTVPLPEIVIPPGQFHLSTRRGKQFNSMTQGERDYLMGAATRQDVLIGADDAARLGVREGDALRLRSEVGEWTGVVRLAPMKERHLQTYWPETNVLIPRRFDPVSGEPDYNAFVTAEPVGPATATLPAPVASTRLERAGAIAALVAAACIAIAPARAGDPVPATPPASAVTPAAAVEFSGHQQLLDEFIRVMSPAGAPIETGFDYEGLFRRLDRNQGLERIRRQFLAVPPSRMNDATRKAWAINFYNYLVIETVALHYFTGVSVQSQSKAYFVRDRTTSVQQIRIEGQKFFQAPLVEIEGVKYSLDRFERHFLFGDFDRNSKAPPPATLDPRVHFALNCASRGCPALMPRAYQPDSLDAQLDFAVRNALANPLHLRWIEERKSLMGSSLFDWYAADFGGPKGALEFARRHAPPAIAALIVERRMQWLSGYIPWDWSYNLPTVAKPGAGAPRSSR